MTYSHTKTYTPQKLFGYSPTTLAISTKYVLIKCCAMSYIEFNLVLYSNYLIIKQSYRRNGRALYYILRRDEGLGLEYFT